MGEPNIGLNCTCNSNCFQWCPRSVQVNCCCKAEASDESSSSSSRDIEDQKTQEVAQETIPKRSCTII